MRARIALATAATIAAWLIAAVLLAQAAGAHTSTAWVAWSAGTEPGGPALQPSGTIIATGGTATQRQVIQNKVVTGYIKVTGPYVTIRNVRINTTARYGIQILPEANRGERGQRTLIEDVDIIGGMAEGRCNYGIVFGEYVARRVDIWRCGNGFWAGSYSHIETSWIHNMRDLPTDHSDGIQSTGGHDIRITGNRIDMCACMTSAILLHGHFNPLQNVMIDHNRFAGGGYSLNLKDRGAGASNLSVHGNVWMWNSWNFGPQQGNALPTGNRWVDNRYSTGAPNER